MYHDEFVLAYYRKDRSKADRMKRLGVIADMLQNAEVLYPWTL